jgi:predicted outer membrane repeat protein
MNAICVGRKRLPIRFGIHGLRPILLSVLCIAWAWCAQAGGVVTNCTQTDLLGALAGGGTVTFACDGTITLTSQLVMTNDTVIDATGHTISLSGNNSTRIFEVTPDTSLSLINLTLENGRADGGDSGSAIRNRNGRVSLVDCAIDRNSGSFGGAIWNVSGSGSQSWLRVTNCTFSRNFSGSGGAIRNEDTLPDPTGDTVLVNCTFYGNIASDTNQNAVVGGGAIFHNRGRLDAINSTFFGNAAIGG